MLDLTGQMIGRYRIVAPLGEGGMAMVYKAYDTHLERQVAIKIIRRGQFGSDHMGKMLQRFEREAKRMAQFMHPNIVPVIDYGEHDGSPYLVMPYLPGGTLKDKLRALAGRPMSSQEAIRILVPVARALEYAHEHDTIHRDVKPANILLTEKGLPLLADFGVAKILDLDEGGTLTGTGVGVGTPEYMAPEQWVNKVVPQTDVYALGIVFYEMVTGRKPYIADTPAGVLVKQSTEPLPRPRDLNPAIPVEVERVLYKALAKDPLDRYPDMGALTDALENLMQGARSSAPFSQIDEGDAKTVDYEQPGQPASPLGGAKAQPSRSKDESPFSSPPATPEAQKWRNAAQPIPQQNSWTPPNPLPSIPAEKPRKSLFQSYLLFGIIGLGLVVILCVVTGSWLLNRPSTTASVKNEETVAANVQETLTVMGKQTPTLIQNGDGNSGMPTDAPKAAPAAGGVVKIGLSFSDFATERWKNEATLMEKLLKEKGYEVMIHEANHDINLQNDQINKMVAQGALALIVVAEDGDAVVPAVDRAAQAGVKVIAYDRLIKTASIAAYISFDNVEVGRQQAAGVLKTLDIDNRKYPVKLVKLGGSPTDNNAILFRKGQDEVLQKYVSKKKIEIVSDQWVENWDPANALKLMENILTATGNKIDAVVASNDGTALGALQAMKAQKLVGKVPISGQDATADGCNSIVKGELTVTIFKDIRKLSPLATDLVDKLLKGETVSELKKFTMAELTNDPAKTGDVNALFLPIVQITKDNVYDEIVKSGFQSYDDVYLDIPEGQRPPRP